MVDHTTKIPAGICVKCNLAKLINFIRKIWILFELDFCSRHSVLTKCTTFINILLSGVSFLGS